MQTQQIPQTLIEKNINDEEAFRNDQEKNSKAFLNAIADGWEIVDKSILSTQDIAMIVWTLKK